MKMKYFRFLFGELGHCFMHLGELKDTSTEENFTVLYLKRTEKYAQRQRKQPVNQLAETGHTLFLCPETIDLLVLGQADILQEKELEKFLDGAAIRTLVVPESCEIPAALSEKAVHIIRLCAKGQEQYDSKGAGWYFHAELCDENSVSLVHGPEREDSFDDCVMNVKMEDGSERCKEEKCPDAYGCALGCTLRKDHDVCRFREADQGVRYVLGTLLLPELSEAAFGETLERCRKILEDKKESLKAIRFFGIPHVGEALWKELDDSKCRRYFLGTGEELDDRTIAEIGRAGLQYRTDVLRPGQGVCCSGFLKYAEEKNNRNQGRENAGMMVK